MILFCAQTNPTAAIHACELVEKAEGSTWGGTTPTVPLGIKGDPEEGRTVRVCEQRAGHALRPYPVVVAGVEGPICFHSLATGNPIAGLSMKKAGACTPLPMALLAAQCIGVGVFHSL